MTIKQVARTIGVSPTTVSHVLHGRGRVSPATRRKVLEQIEEVGYTPNLTAQRLVTGPTRMVALDFGSEADLLGNLYTVELTRGIQDALQPECYGLLLNSTPDTLAAGALLAARKMGLRVPEELSLVDHNDVSFARLSALTSVRIDCQELGRRAVETLFSLISDPATPPQPVVVHTGLVQSGSVAPRPSAASAWVPGLRSRSWTAGGMDLLKKGMPS